MKAERIFQGNSLEEVAVFLAEELKKQYYEILFFLKEASLDDIKEYKWAEYHIKNDEDVILEEVHSKILLIAQNRKANKEFYKKWDCWPRSRKIISITGNGKFFSRDEFNLAIGRNIEYLVNIRSFLVLKCYYFPEEKYPD